MVPLHEKFMRQMRGSKMKIMMMIIDPKTITPDDQSPFSNPVQSISTQLTSSMPKYRHLDWLKIILSRPDWLDYSTGSQKHNNSENLHGETHASQDTDISRGRAKLGLSVF